MVRALNLSFEDELNQNKFELLNALVNGKCTCVRHLQGVPHHIGSLLALNYKFLLLIRKFYKNELF